jgi:hypothetical protein
MIDSGYAERAAAVESLLRAVFKKLAVEDQSPRIDRLPDNQHWWRYGQESFVGLRRRAWLMPPYVPIMGWLDKFPEMAAVRAAYDEDPLLGPRVDAMLGTIVSRTGRNFDWLLIEHVVEPLVLSAGSYDFDEAAFRDIYAQFERGFGATTVTMVEFLPLNGFESALPHLELPDGLVIRPMTDGQMHHAISMLAVPRTFGGGVNSVQISRLDQWALTQARTCDVVAGHVEVVPPDAEPFPTLDEPANRLITALRVICGGSAISTRSMYAESDDEFPVVLGARGMGNSFGAADYARPTRLMPEVADAVRIVYLALSLPDVQQDHALQVAVRRVVFAGSRNDDRDRLIDLSIAAEAMFIQRSNLPKDHLKRVRIEAGAARMLGNDPELGASPAEVGDFMARIYRARNAEIHGDPTPYGGLRRLSGTPTDSLALAVADAEIVMRRAIYLALQEHVKAALAGSSAASAPAP